MTSTDRGTDRPTQPTRQGRAVVEALEAEGGFRSAQEIHALLEERGSQVALATVYRTLQRLADTGEVDLLRAGGGEATYRRCSVTHHHHLVCRACGATVEVEGPAVERWTRTVAEDHGFVDVSHTLEVFGTCAACRPVDVASRPQALP